MWLYAVCVYIVLARYDIFSPASPPRGSDEMKKANEGPFHEFFPLFFCGPNAPFFLHSFVSERGGRGARSEAWLN